MTETNNNPEIDDVMKSVEQQTDVIYAIKEIFKNDKLNVRTRLTYRGLRAHAIINYLKDLRLKESDNVSDSVVMGLQAFSDYIKELLISIEGKSREEMVKVFQNNLMNEAQKGSSWNFLSPQTGGK